MLYPLRRTLRQSYSPYSIACSGCDEAKEHEDRIELAEAQITVDGKTPECGDKVENGTHNNIRLEFCLPSKKQYLEAIGSNDKTWKRIVKVAVRALHFYTSFIRKNHP